MLPEDDLALLEFQSIITAFERLPPQDERDPDLIAERRREQVVAKRRLADLVADRREVARAIEETVRVINGEPGDPARTASTRSTGCWTRSRTASPRSARRARRSTTAASSPSTSWPPCARRSRRSSPRRTTCSCA